MKEYKVAHLWISRDIYHNPSERGKWFENTLNEYAKEGWEVIDIHLEHTYHIQSITNSDGIDERGSSNPFEKFIKEAFVTFVRDIK